MSEFEVIDSNNIRHCELNLNDNFVGTLLEFKSRLSATKNLKKIYTRILNGVFNGEGFRLPAPWGGGYICSYDSFKFKWSRNVILFQVDGDYIAIVQKYYFIDQIFFFNKRTLLKLNETFEDDQNFCSSLYDDIADFIDNNESLGKIKKPLLSLETNRPFHTYYPILGSLCFINNFVSDKEVFYSKQATSFLDFESFFSWLNRSETLDEVHSTYQIRTECWSFSSMTDKDSEIVEYAKNYKIRDETIESTLDQCDILIWLDLNSEKRSLQNRLSLFERILEHIRERQSQYPITLYLDGLTQPLESRTPKVFDSDKTELEKALTYFSELGITNFIVGSGLNPYEKLKVASKASFFASDAGTASIYPDRFCKIEGIIYKPNGWAAPGHLHFNSTIVPEKYIRNLDNTPPVNCNYLININFSINFFERGQ
ncbi:hypothetical protein [Alteromonas lipolytica]|uniref:Uncharacterized protein n=1 Tax=Alteromonas lipolytica TaxID=1856405 RepID=A0A1E8FEU8_9ALTE|nr:hypothetical protein [Alteromonas lipolytica]OFI34444.1 hypothetical protein BFC17_17560 [Alteromonas lipolytica]GGF84569.1 hypothetical protein GCM10011338_41160 [Alteromonas lipolytica]